MQDYIRSGLSKKKTHFYRSGSFRKLSPKDRVSNVCARRFLSYHRERISAKPHVDLVDLSRGLRLLFEPKQDAQ